MRLVHLVSWAAVWLLAACGDASKTAPDDAAAPEPKSYTERIRGTDVTFEMVWVPHAKLWVGRTEVTWDEYLLFCDFEEEGKAPPNIDATTRPSKPQDDVAPFDRDWGTGQRPAVGMSRNAASKYCAWLSQNTGNPYRLPTEAEWESFCGGAPADPVADYAWCRENSQLRTQEVGQKKPNVHGLHDVLGNLWEYCSDPLSKEEPELAVMRGGSWKEPGSQHGQKSRLGFDEAWLLPDPNVPPGVWWVPDAPHVGFRLVRAPD